MLPQTSVDATATHRTKLDQDQICSVAALAVFADGHRTGGQHEPGDVVEKRSKASSCWLVSVASALTREHQPATTQLGQVGPRPSPRVAPSDPASSVGYPGPSATASELLFVLGQKSVSELRTAARAEIRSTKHLFPSHRYRTRTLASIHR